MDTNVKGRPIHTGPRGGRYVLEKGRKIYKFRVRGAGVSPTGNTNVKGRPIYKGSRGGRYVLEKGRKIYKFRVRATAAAAPTLPNKVKQRLLKLATNMRRRRIKPNTRNFKTKTITRSFKSFNTVDPTRPMTTTQENIQIHVPESGTLTNMIKEGTVLGVTEDTLPQQSWLYAQSRYLASLDWYDIYTAMAYTVRSHQWIGPWLRGNKTSVRFTKPPGHTNPLYPQIVKLAYLPKYRTSPWAQQLIASRNPYQLYIDTSPYIYPIDEAIKMYTNDLKRIIKNAPPLPNTIYVYRGLQTNIFDGKIGSKDTLKEFASAGYIPQSCYAADNYMRLKLLKGTRVLLLQGLNHWNDSGECEIVLNKGSHYVIRKRYLDRYAYNVKNLSYWYRRVNKVTDVTVFSS